MKNKPKLHIDFETRSTCDLKTAGTVVYAAHRMTHVLVAWIEYDGNWYVFDPTRNRKQIRKLMEQVYDDKTAIVAHNWSFEYAIMRWCCTRLYDWPTFPPSRFECSMGTSLRYGLPGSLEANAEYLQTGPKDTEGHRIMLRLTKPRAPLKAETSNGKEQWVLFDNDPCKFKKNSAYCRQDVVAESAMLSVIPPLSKREQKIFRLDQKVNTRGIPVDIKLCRGAIKINEDYERQLIAAVPARAWNAFGSIRQRAKVQEWIQREDKGIFLPNMQMDTIAAALRTCLDDDVKAVLTAYQLSGGQASNKYAAVLRQQYKGKLYFQLQYCGASSTGRWSGRGVQLQNLARPTVDYDPAAVELIQSGNYDALAEYTQDIKLSKSDKPATVADILKSYIRCFLIPQPGALLAVNDYASVEARKVFWYAKDKTGLRVFKSGDDPYKWMASRIYGKKISDVTAAERFVGKQAILGMGYGMGAPRFIDQCASYGQHVSMTDASKSISTYRTTFANVVRTWYALENAVKALLDGNIVNYWHEVDYVRYRYDGTNVYCELPSGTVLTYHRMTLEGTDLYYWTTPMQGPRKMMQRKIWGGTLFENICQASARDLMADAMLRLDAYEFDNVIQVHDEMVNEVGHTDCMPEVQACIRKVPKWCAGFPLEIEGAVMDRYRKI